MKPLCSLSADLFRKLLPPLGLLVCPNAQALPGAVEFGPTVLANLDLALTPTQDVGPFLPSVFLADFHPLVPTLAVRHDDL